MYRVPGSHVAHRDVAVITVASFLGVLAGLLVRFTFCSQLFGGRGRHDQNTAAILAAGMAETLTVRRSSGRIGRTPGGPRFTGLRRVRAGRRRR